MNSPHQPGSPEGPVSGFSAVPPPPPPPPVPGQVPAVRISTASELGQRKSQLTAGPQDPYEPPAAIQNAMMTKDKKPFTYTPGMGGKLDLSQIRSPRMARRVAKNANDEGIEGPPKFALAQEPRSPPTQQPNIYSHPQVAVPVFPQGGPQPSANLRNSTLPRSPPVVERQSEPVPKPVMKVETKIQPVSNVPDTPTPPTSPTQVTLAKAPTPWMQKQVKQQDELPEWAKRSNNRSQDSSSSGSESPLQQQPPPLTRQTVVNPPRQQTQTQPQMRPVRQENERVIPLRIEDRPSVFSAMNETGHHQLMNTTPHHQSRWGNPVGQSAPVQQQQGGAYIIPVQVDSQQQYQTPNTVSSPINANHNQMQYRNVPVENQANRNVPRGYVSNQQAEPGPVQSKSFRVLQKITDTDADQMDGEQLRKLQLTEDDRYLMNKFKEQVDGDTYLHQEEDPRYRGAAIPSRAFRYLQNMTDSGDVSNTNTTPRPVNSAIKKQNRNSKTFEEAPVHIPPSEQQAPEPKKYMGGAIPSRSFRILQAMTAPESIGSQWRYDSSTTPTSCTTTTTEKSDRLTEEQPHTSSSPSSSLPSENESESEEEKNRCGSSSKRNDEEEENASAESSDSSCDSDSYLAYSTGLNPLNPQKDVALREDIKEVVKEEDDENNDSTDCEKESLLEDDQEVEKEEEDEEKEKINQTDDQEDMTTVSVSLPLRFKFSVSEKNEDVTTVIVGDSTITHDVETCVDFTLKRPSLREKSEEKVVRETTQVKPTVIVSATDEDRPESSKLQDETASTNTSIEDKRKTLLSVQSHSREEITDDEDSGVTSDMSRIISEVDTDSECCLTTATTINTAPAIKKSGNNKYQRTQTHSRLFRLLSDEHMKLPTISSSLSNHEENSSNSSGLTSPDCTPGEQSIDHLGILRSARDQLPTRPKSLDCEALFKRQQNNQPDSYYQTWKKGERSPRKSPLTAGQWTYPRINVLCPRIKSAKNVPQTLVPKNHQQQSSRMKSPLGSTMISSSIPSPVRTSKRC